MRTFPAHVVLGGLLGILVLATPDALAQAPQAPAKAPPVLQQSLPPLAYSRWAKFCVKSQETGSRQVCLTGKDGKSEDGRAVVSAVVIEVEGEARRALGVMLPIGVALTPGCRVFVDESEPMTGPYQLCQPVGCFSEHGASAELIGRLKKGRNLVLQAIQPSNQAITLFIPLAGFAAAYDGPPTDAQVYERQQELENGRKKRWPLGDYWLPGERERNFGR